jgi:hypothetical protein
MLTVVAVISGAESIEIFVDINVVEESGAELIEIFVDINVVEESD